MDIKKALLLTGKAIPVNDDCGGYVSISGENLHWFNHGTNEKTFRVSIQAIMNTPWLPYYEEEEIRPENAGELWYHEDTDYRYDGNFAILTVSPNDDVIKENVIKADELYAISFRSEVFPSRCGFYCNIIHGKNGWSRVHPTISKVPEDEEIEELTGEPEFPFYVKITGCSGEDFWYNDKIGNYYKVIGREIDDDLDDILTPIKQYKIDDGVSLIRLDDCERVELQEI